MGEVRLLNFNFASNGLNKTKFPFFLTALISSIAFERLRIGLSQAYEFATAQDIARGVGEVPYQYRCLIPKLCLTMQELVDSPSFDACLYAIDVIACMTIIYGVRSIFDYFQKPGFIGNAASLLTLLPVAWCCFVMPGAPAPFLYPYDLPSTAFFTIGLALILHGKYRHFQWLFLAGTFNRETTLFLLFPYLRMGNIDGGKKTILRAGLLLGLWSLIKGFLWIAYYPNPGRIVHTGIIKNLPAIASPITLMCLATVGFGMWIPLFIYRRHIPERLAALLSCLLPFILIMFMAGYVLELRIFLEIIPLLWVSGIITVKSARSVNQIAE